MSDSNEEEIASIYTTLGVLDDTFCGQQHLTADDLLPIFSALKHQCDGIIKCAGTYVFRLQVTKIK